MKANLPIRVLSAALGLTALAAAALPGAKPKLDPESRKFYATAHLIMTKEESRIWARLPDAASRREFVADFWLKRDPDPATPENEFRKEFEARVAYVNKRFNKEGGPGYNTDRGRVYIFMGPPDKIDEYNPDYSTSIRGFTDIWVYYGRQMAVVFADERGDGRFRIVKTEGDFFGAMDLMKLGRRAGPDDAFASPFVKFETVYDPGAREIVVRFPAASLMFRENEDGLQEVDLRFLIYIYPGGGTAKRTFSEARRVALTGAELGARKTVELRFAQPLEPGPNTVDVIVMGQGERGGKLRQIFEIKVPAGAPDAAPSD
ncbi:MAG TPA: GWxTD domain-containing protein [Candidatus Aminicenantes bacterium]|nr:GWxTD domain-containing protein [Candidatus Aminicenantes bacterium]HRY64956.1 GWxTD domain-containing protein [Candidatus Aminicenantes bacterium]HRZ71869.1 GWxTD domain-containing protein [Candidatus Aminicenantes bacterium]